jgi:hypothetical protein
MKDLAPMPYNSARPIAHKIIHAKQFEPLKSLIKQSSAVEGNPGTNGSAPNSRVPTRLKRKVTDTANPGRRGLDLSLYGVDPMEALRAVINIEVADTSQTDFSPSPNSGTKSEQ